MEKNTGAQNRETRPLCGPYRASGHLHRQRHPRPCCLSGDTEMKFRAVALSTLAIAASVFSQGLDPAKLGQPPTDSWPTYNGDYSGRRFSTLSKINTDNIGSLSLAWVYHLDPGSSTM